MFILEAQLELNVRGVGEKRSDEVGIVIFIDERNEGTQKTRSVLEKEKTEVEFDNIEVA